jgi:hypothetical protein
MVPAVLRTVLHLVLHGSKNGNLYIPFQSRAILRRQGGSIGSAWAPGARIVALACLALGFWLGAIVGRQAQTAYPIDMVSLSSNISHAAYEIGCDGASG